METDSLQEVPSDNLQLLHRSVPTSWLTVNHTTPPPTSFKSDAVARQLTGLPTAYCSLLTAQDPPCPLRPNTTNHCQEDQIGVMIRTGPCRLPDAGCLFGLR